MDSLSDGIINLNINRSEQSSSEQSSSEQKWFIKAFIIKEPADKEADVAIKKAIEDGVKRADEKADENADENAIKSAIKETVRRVFEEANKKADEDDIKETVQRVIEERSFQKDKEHIKDYIRYLKTDLEEDQIVREDLNIKDIKKEFKKIPKAVEDGNYTHFLLIFSAHGSVGKIVCSDGEEFDWLTKIKKLHKKNEKFRAIPKVIIIDVCQGIVENEVDNVGGTQSTSDGKYVTKCLNFENFFYCFSTIEGYGSPLFLEGSLYLRCLFYQLLANAYAQSNKEIESKLTQNHTKTNAMVAKYKEVVDKKIYMQMSCYFFTLIEPLIIKYKEMDPRPTTDDLQQKFNLKAFLEPNEVHEPVNER